MDTKNQIMKNKRVLMALILGTLLSACSITSKQNKSNARNDQSLNIILIVADDLGWSDLACYGNKFIETPNLDALSKEGVMFTNAYAAAPLCSPTRASIITGNNPARINMTEHLHGYTPPTKNQKIAPPRIITGLPSDLITIPEALKELNYQTAHFGKWHLGKGVSSPAASGFDFVYGGGEEGLPKTFFYPFFWGKPYKDLLADTKEGDYLDDALTTKALDYLTKKKNEKFFIELNFYAPHVPIEGKPDLVKKYENKRMKTGYKGLPENEYAAMVENVDFNVGRILNYLKDTGLDQNTVVFFMSDNGGLTVQEVPAFAKHTPPTTITPLKGGKGSINEGGIRIPFFIKVPKNRNGDLDNQALISTDDIFNTCMDFAGLQRESPDGLSIIKNNLKNKGILYWHFPHYSPQKGLPADAIREGDYKLIEWYDTGNLELYNLKTDISESNNIAVQNPKIVKELRGKLKAWKRKVNAVEPNLNPNYSEDSSH